ncbi:hypothetical protein BDS110ZK25_70570 [Bradyrhizobium diazoefficiens]
MPEPDGALKIVATGEKEDPAFDRLGAAACRSAEHVDSRSYRDRESLARANRPERAGGLKDSSRQERSRC